MSVTESRERTVFLTSEVEKTEYLHAEECNWNLILYDTQKLTQNKLKT